MSSVLSTGIYLLIFDFQFHFGVIILWYYSGCPSHGGHRLGFRTQRGFVGTVCRANVRYPVLLVVYSPGSFASALRAVVLSIPSLERIGVNF